MKDPLEPRNVMTGLNVQMGVLYRMRTERQLHSPTNVQQATATHVDDSLNSKADGVLNSKLQLGAHLLSQDKRNKVSADDR